MTGSTMSKRWGCPVVNQVHAKLELWFHRNVTLKWQNRLCQDIKQWHILAFFLKLFAFASHVLMSSSRLIGVESHIWFLYQLPVLLTHISANITVWWHWQEVSSLQSILSVGLFMIRPTVRAFTHYMLNVALISRSDYRIPLCDSCNHRLGASHPQGLWHQRNMAAV